MPARRRILPRQLDILISFMEKNKELARGSLSKAGGPLGKRETNKKWSDLSKKLNEVPGGTVKNENSWRQYWSNLKCKIRAKAVEAKRHMGGTGGGPPSEEGILTEEEERIICILGEDSIFGEESVRIPFEEPEVPRQRASTEQASGRVSQITNEHCYAINLRKSQDAGSDTLRVPTSMDPSPSSSNRADEHSYGVNSSGSQDAGSNTPRVPISMGPSLSSPNHGYRRPIPNIPEWAVIIEERNTQAQERQAAALEIIVDLIRKVITILNSRS